MLAADHSFFQLRSSRPLVFFDFDGTLTKIDSTARFAFFMAGERVLDRDFLLTRGLLLLSNVGLVSNHWFKRFFARRFFAGKNLNELSCVTDEFFDKYLDKMTDEKMLGLLHKHVQKGDKVFIVSANFDFYLMPLQERWKLSGIIAKQTERAKNVLTGRLVGKACHGSEKLRRVIRRFGRPRVARAIAYGDAKSDLFLINNVERGYLITDNGNTGFLSRLFG